MPQIVRMRRCGSAAERRYGNRRLRPATHDEDVRVRLLLVRLSAASWAWTACADLMSGRIT